MVQPGSESGMTHDELRGLERAARNEQESRLEHETAERETRTNAELIVRDFFSRAWARNLEGRRWTQLTRRAHHHNQQDDRSAQPTSRATTNISEDANPFRFLDADYSLPGTTPLNHRRSSSMANILSTPQSEVRANRPLQSNRSDAPDSAFASNNDEDEMDSATTGLIQFENWTRRSGRRLS